MTIRVDPEKILDTAFAVVLIFNIVCLILGMSGCGARHPVPKFESGCVQLADDGSKPKPGKVCQSSAPTRLPGVNGVTSGPDG